MSRASSVVVPVEWAAETSREACHSSGLHLLALGYQSSSSAMVVTADINGGMRLWQWRDGYLKYARRMQSEGHVIRTLAVPNSESSLLVTADSGGVRLWDIRVGVQTGDLPGTEGANLVAVSQDGALVAVTIPDTNELLLYDVDEKELVAQRSDAGNIVAMSFVKPFVPGASSAACQGGLLVTTSSGSTRILCDATLETRIEIGGGDESSTVPSTTAALSVSPDGTLVSTSSRDDEFALRFWSTSSGALISAADFDAPLVPRSSCVQYNPARYWITVVAGDEIVSWDLVLRTTVARFAPVPPASSASDDDDQEEDEGAFVKPTAMEWSVDGKTLFVAYADGRLRWFRDRSED